jgi:RNA polymerase sigma factor for flagellar operon FliA
MNNEERQKLWEEYAKRKTSDLYEKIITEYAGLVKLVAGRLSMYLGHNVEYDDLVGYGTFGLIDAIEKFDYTKGNKFETYASLRIRGAILDQIRKMDWIPRSIRQKQRKIENAYQALESKLGRNITDEDIADELNLSIEEFEEWQNQTNITNIISLDEFIEQGSESKTDQYFASTFEQPDRIVEQKEIKELLARTLETLTEKEKRVIVLYYYEDLTLKEISKVLEVSESRISQLHTKALQKLKAKLGVNVDILTSY